jgi:hypothetical protein
MDIMIAFIPSVTQQNDLSMNGNTRDKKHYTGEFKIF